MKGILVLNLVSLFLVAGCAQQDEKKFTERAEAEGRGANKATQELLIEKAREMESELTERQKFYGAIEGQYQGTTQVENQPYNIKFTFSRSVPPYFGSRTRQLSEVESDINNLSFNVQVVQWHPEDTSTAVGCRVNQIRPDMLKGVIVISSPDCPNLYTVVLSDLSNESVMPPREKAKSIAEKLRKHELESVTSLIGTIEPTSNANILYFSVNKVNK